VSPAPAWVGSIAGVRALRRPAYHACEIEPTQASVVHVVVQKQVGCYSYTGLYTGFYWVVSQACGHCEFQDLLMRYNVDDSEVLPKRPRVNPAVEAQGVAHAHDTSSPALQFDFDKCILCLRFVSTPNLTPTT